MTLKIYCLPCRKHTDNVGSKRVIMINAVIRDESKCATCNNKESRFFKKT